MTDVDHTLSRKDLQALEVAHLYYDAKLTQAEIGERVHLSRPTVSKLLAYAQRRGYVRIEVCDPRERSEVLIRALKERFSLAEVRLVGGPQHLPGQMRAALGAQGAEVLSSVLRDSDVVGIQACPDLADLVHALGPAVIKDLTVVQMAGHLTGWLSQRQDKAVARMLAGALHATLVPMCCPLLADSVPQANMIRVSSEASGALASISTARVAVFSATPMSRLEPVLDRLGLTAQDEALLRQHAVGEVCARILDTEGRVCLPDLNSRTLGISLTELRHVEQRILVAGGPGYGAVIRSALANGYANRLVTNVETAREVLALEPDPASRQSPVGGHGAPSGAL